MITKRGMRPVTALLAACGLAVTLSGPAFAHERDQDEALYLRRQGKILPLETIIRKAREQYQGRLIESELEEHDGHYTYEIELVGPDGIVHKLRYDAHTGQPVSDTVKNRREKDHADPRGRR
ncbi:MAG: PepSY domain-containing protein [Gammaproteobacteria bacterium]